MKKPVKTELDKIKDLMYGVSLTETRNNNIPKENNGNGFSQIVETRNLPNNKTIAIVKEGFNYILKEAATKENLSYSDFSIVGGIGNQPNVTFSSLNSARNNVIFKIKTLNEELGIETEIEDNNTVTFLNENKTCVNEGEEEEESEEDEVNIEDIDENFEYKGQEYEVNPFAVCNKTVGQDDKEKFERCVKGVKSDSKIKKESKDNTSDGIQVILESKLYKDFIDTISEKFLKEVKMENEAVMLNVPQENIPSNVQQVAPSAPEQTNDKSLPFEKEKFDAGVEADEDTDPKKYIEQLTGKLAQVMRKYNDSNERPDLDTEKYVINMILSASHTDMMDEEDKKDIVEKIKTGEVKEEEPKDEKEAKPEEEETKEIQKEELVPLEVENNNGWDNDKIANFFGQLGASILSSNNGVTQDNIEFKFTIGKNGDVLMVQFPTEEDAEVFNGLINKYLGDEFNSNQNMNYPKFLMIKFN